MRALNALAAGDDVAALKECSSKSIVGEQFIEDSLREASGSDTNRAIAGRRSAKEKDGSITSHTDGSHYPGGGPHHEIGASKM